MAIRSTMVGEWFVEEAKRWLAFEKAVYCRLPEEDIVKARDVHREWIRKMPVECEWKLKEELEQHGD